MVTFTLQEFLAMIARYNASYWPIALLAYALGVGAAILALKRGDSASRFVAGVLILFWLWTGVVFNGLVFSGLSGQAVLFAVLFVVEAFLVAATGVFKQQLRFNVRADVYGVVGGLAILYGMIGYPVVAALVGRGYSHWLLLGLTPCPTVVYTLGLLLWSARPLPKAVLAIPALYALGGGMLAASQGIVEDIGMVALAVFATGLLLYRDRRGGRRLMLSTPSGV